MVFNPLNLGLKEGYRRAISVHQGKHIDSATLSYSSDLNSESTGLVCYEDQRVNQTSRVTCNYLSVLNTEIARIDVLGNGTVEVNATRPIIAPLSDTSAGVCYTDLGSHTVFCRHVTLNRTEGSVTLGMASVALNHNRTTDLTMAKVADNVAVVCYRLEPYGYGECSSLKFDGDLAPVIVTSSVITTGDTRSLSVAQTRENLAMVCYRNHGRRGKGTCTEIEYDVGTGDNINAIISLIINDDMMLPCPPGRYRTATQGDLVKGCINCPAGRYRSRNKGRSPQGCKACPIGKYAPVTGSVQVSDCQRCPAGKTAEEEGMGQCKCITGRSCDMRLTDTNGMEYRFFQEPDVVDFFRESVPYVGRS